MKKLRKFWKRLNEILEEWGAEEWGAAAGWAMRR